MMFLKSHLLAAFLWLCVLGALTIPAQAQTPAPGPTPFPPLLSSPAAPAAPRAPTAPTAPQVSAPGAPLINLQVGNGNDRQNLSTAIQIVIVMTLLTLAPSLIMLMTSFTRIVIVLGFVRTALGVPSAPANQLLIGISIFITFFIMAPVWQQIQEQAINPYMNEQISSNEAMDRAVEMLRRVYIPEPERRVHAYPHQMSGGMRQRVMIAMALSCNPKVLIADEPTTALDVTIQAQILDLMRELQETYGTAIVLITHDMGVVAENADRVVVMYAGRKVEEAAAADLFDNPGHPYTKGLLGSIPHLDTAAQSNGARARLNEIKGMVPSLFDLPPGCSFAPRCGFATDRCRGEQPVLEEQRPGHWVACWHADRLLGGAS